MKLPNIIIIIFLIVFFPNVACKLLNIETLLQDMFKEAAGLFTCVACCSVMMNITVICSE